MSKKMFKGSRNAIATPPPPQSGVSMTVTGLRLSTAEIVADYLKGRRPMVTPTPDQYDASDEHAGYMSAYHESEYLARVKEEHQNNLRSQQEAARLDREQKDARLAELEAHYERTRHLSAPSPAPEA